MDKKRLKRSLKVKNENSISLYYLAASSIFIRGEGLGYDWEVGDFFSLNPNGRVLLNDRRVPNYCNRCGDCCERMECEHLSYRGKTAVCGIYESRNFECRSYPFTFIGGYLRLDLSCEAGKGSLNFLLEESGKDSKLKNYLEEISLDKKGIQNKLKLLA